MKRSPVLSAYREAGLIDNFPLHDNELLKRYYTGILHDNQILKSYYTGILHDMHDNQILKRYYTGI